MSSSPATDAAANTPHYTAVNEERLTT